MAKKTRNDCIQNLHDLDIYDADCDKFYKLSHEEKANPQIFEKYCKKLGGYYALLLSDDEICDDKNLVMIARKYGFYGGYFILSERLLNDPEMAIALAECNRGEFAQFSKSIREDIDLMLQALSINTGIYRSLPVKVRIDKRVLFYIAERDPYQLQLLKSVKKESLYALFSDSEVLERVFTVSDINVFKEKLSQNVWAIQFIDQQYWNNDKGLVEFALRIDGNLLGVLPEYYRTKKKYALIAVNSNPYAIKYCSEELLDDKDVIMKALQEDTEEILSYASERIRGLYDVVYKAVSVDALNLQFASDELRDNRDIVLCAVNCYGGSLDFASERLQKDKELMKISKQNW